MPALESGNIFLPSTDASVIQSTALSMNTAADYFSLMCQIPQTGTITGMKFATGSVNTGCTLTATIEGIVDAKPDGVLYDANATGTVVVANTDDNVTKTVTFAGNVSATRGDFVAIRLTPSTGTPTAMQIRTQTTLFTSGFPYTQYYASATNTWSQAMMCYSLVYDTGDVTPYGVTFNNVNANVSISSSTTPDEAGIKLTAPYSASVMGLFWRVTTGSNAQDVDLILYDEDDNVLASQSFSKEYFETASTNINNTVKLLLDANVAIKKGRVYRVVLKPTTTTTWTNMFQTINNPEIQWDGDANAVYTTRTNAGAWTDDSTKIAPLGMIIDQIYQPGGSFL
jgi:hypothetical protein